MAVLRTQLISSFMLICLTVPISGYAEDSYSIVLAGGRVVDPESGLDAIRHIGLQDGRIARISELPLEGDCLRQYASRGDARRPPTPFDRSA